MGLRPKESTSRPLVGRFSRNQRAAGFADESGQMGVEGWLQAERSEKSQICKATLATRNCWIGGLDLDLKPWLS